jgi:hypothetical protein
MTNNRSKHHYVPKFYLEYWKPPDKNFVYFHDIETQEIKKINPRNNLAIHDYYEYSKLFSPAQVEASLSKSESQVSELLNKIIQKIKNRSSVTPDITLIQDIVGLFDPKKVFKLLEFYTYQYLRVPSANEQKRQETSHIPLPQETIAEHMHPATMTIEGFNYTMPRLMRTMCMVLSIDLENALYSSDRPAFDFMPGYYRPEVGIEIGNDPGVAGMMPLHPNILLTLLHNSNPFIPVRLPKFRVIFSTPEWTNAANEYIVQHAYQYVVSDKEDRLIFDLRTRLINNFPIPI